MTDLSVVRLGGPVTTPAQNKKIIELAKSIGDVVKSGYEKAIDLAVEHTPVSARNFITSKEVEKPVKTFLDNVVSVCMGAEVAIGACMAPSVVAVAGWAASAIACSEGDDTGPIGRKYDDPEKVDDVEKNNDDDVETLKECKDACVEDYTETSDVNDCKAECDKNEDPGEPEEGEYDDLFNKEIVEPMCTNSVVNNAKRFKS